MNFKGKTVKDAILKAVESLGVNEEELEIKVVQEPVRGILGIGQKDAQIEVSLKETTVAEMLDIEETAVIEENKVEHESVAIKAGIKEEKIARATAFIKEIISQLGYTVEYFIREEQNFVIINIRGKNAGKLIGKRGETLYAIQYLVNIEDNKKEENYEQGKQIRD